MANSRGEVNRMYSNASKRPSFNRNFHEPNANPSDMFDCSSATKKARMLLFVCGRQSHSGLMIDCKCVFDVGQCSKLTTSPSISVFSRS